MLFAALALGAAACSGIPKLSPTPPGAPGAAPAPKAIATHYPARAKKVALPAGKVVVWGDSLVAEASPYLNLLGSVDHGSIDVRTWGGTAICDWFHDMYLTLPRAHADVVVFAFSGNALTSCMETPAGAPITGDAYFSKYDADARAATALARASHARVVWVLAPQSHKAMADPHWAHINKVFRHVAETESVAYVDTGALIAPHGHYTLTMPCLPHERTIVNSDGTRSCNDGRVIVRAPDGAHFCPVGKPAKRGVTEGCPVYSSGAFRYSEQIVNAARWAMLD